MKKIILTSPSFTGEVELLYSSEGKLIFLDMMNSELSESQVFHMKEKAPVMYEKETFLKAFKSETLKAVEVDYTVTFDMFWETYDLKRNRDRCEKIWSKSSEADKTMAYSGIRTYNRHLALNTWKNKADPENYLKKKFWLNEWK